MRVVWLARSLRGLAEIEAFYTAANPAAGARVVGALRAAGEGLSVLPHRGRPGPAGTRESVVARRHILVYRVSGDRVRVLRVWHVAQNRLR